MNIERDAVAIDPSGNVVVTGTSKGAYYTAKYAVPNGALVWEKRYRGVEGLLPACAVALAVDTTGNVIVTGDPWGAAAFPQGGRGL